MKLDLIGKRFGRLTVLRRDEGRYRVVCACDCGKEWRGYLYSLTSGDTTSCGCYGLETRRSRKYGQRHVDMVGMRFGRLTVIARSQESKDRSRSAKWHCRCSCGTEVVVSRNSLRSGLTASCGCFQRDAVRAVMTKHGQYKEPAYLKMLDHKRRATKASAFIELVNPSVVYERDMGLCGICGLPVEAGEFNLDHRIPLSEGGQHSYANCQTAHASCNFRKGRKLPEQCTHLWARF